MSFKNSIQTTRETYWFQCIDIFELELKERRADEKRPSRVERVVVFCQWMPPFFGAYQADLYLCVTVGSESGVEHAQTASLRGFNAIDGLSH